MLVSVFGKSLRLLLISFTISLTASPTGQWELNHQRLKLHALWQVHKARLKDGKQVAVKVQYLGLESAVAADLSTLSLLGAIAALIFPNSFEFG